MLDRTDRHFRHLIRLISARVTLYTEMVPCQGLVYGDADRFLVRGEDAVLQLAGSDPELLKRSCEIAADYGYGEINLNAGCPSPKVQAGNFGAALMKDSDLARRCLDAMRAGARDAKITIKTRICIDDGTPGDGYDRMTDFLGGLGCDKVIIHARKANLKLSTALNLVKPPIDYTAVYRLKAARPDWTVVVNGDIVNLQQVISHLQKVDRVMMGRMAYAAPFMFAEGGLTRDEVAEKYFEYAVQCDNPRQALVRAMGLYYGQPGAGDFRRRLLALHS